MVPPAESFRTVVSATYRLPSASTAKPRGFEICAERVRTPLRSTRKTVYELMKKTFPAGSVVTAVANPIEVSVASLGSCTAMLTPDWLDGTPHGLTHSWKSRALLSKYRMVLSVDA